MTKIAVLGMLIILVALAVPHSAVAGCCDVLVMDSLPADVVAGEPVTIVFTVHGPAGTKRSTLKPVVRATNVTSGEIVRAAAVFDGTPGHYVATVVFPEAGDWDWTVWASKMPVLSVAPSGDATADRTEPDVTLAAVVPDDPSSIWIAVALASGLASIAAFVMAGGVALRRMSLPGLVGGG